YKIGVYGPGDALTSLHSLGLTDLAYYWVDNHWGGTSYSTPNIERDLNGVSASPTSIGVQVDTDTSFGSEFGQWTTGVSTPGPGVVLSDFNGDGTSDILWRNDTNGQVLDWQMSNGTKQKGILFATPGSTLSFAGVGDFNGDGTSDILWQNNNG